MNDTQKLKAINKYLKTTRKELNKSLKGDWEYNTVCGQRSKLLRS